MGVFCSQSTLTVRVIECKKPHRHSSIIPYIQNQHLTNSQIPVHLPTAVILESRLNRAHIPFIATTAVHISNQVLASMVVGGRPTTSDLKDATIGC